MELAGGNAQVPGNRALVHIDELDATVRNDVESTKHDSSSNQKVGVGGCISEGPHLPWNQPEQPREEKEHDSGPDKKPGGDKNAQHDKGDQEGANTERRPNDSCGSQRARNRAECDARRRKRVHHCLPPILACRYADCLADAYLESPMLKKHGNPLQNTLQSSHKARNVRPLGDTAGQWTDNRRMTPNSGTPSKLLVVDDEPNIRDLLASSLRFAGFEVSTASDGASALTEMQDEAPDLIVLDVMLPDMSGFELTEKLRNAGIDTPVLFLTARDAMEDKIEGLTVGGDDYVTKPFGLEEVVARIHAILRRTVGQPEEAGIMRVADIEMDDNAHEVRRGGHPVDLSPTEYRLLRYLMLNEGRVVSKMQILDYVWQYDWGGDGAIVESYISYLRKKLSVTDDSPELIHTRRGVGYMLRENA